MDQLGNVRRLAVAYAPAAVRLQWQATLAIDAKIAETALRPGETMLRQLRLAWWRDQLLSGTGNDPALVALQSTGLNRDRLAGLVNGWEELVTAEQLNDTAVQACANARADLLVNLAQVLGCDAQEASVRVAATRWARVDLGQSLNLPLATSPAATVIKLPKVMRPLAVLDMLARRSHEQGSSTMPGGLIDFLAAVRIGLLGR